MPTQEELERKASRFQTALRRIDRGLRTQQSRIVGAAAAAPTRLAGEYPFKDLTGSNDLDLDYYAFDLGRLQDVARAMHTTFHSNAMAEALAAFDASIPHLRKVRNPLTHVDGRERLDHVAWLSSLVQLNGDGSVEYLVDPRGAHHDAALSLIEQLIEALKPWIQPGKDAPRQVRRADR